MSLVSLQAAAPLLVMVATALALLVLAMVRRQPLVAMLLSVGGTAAAFATLVHQGTSGAGSLLPLFALDGFGLFITGLILLATCAVSLMAHGYLTDTGAHHEEFHLLLVLAAVGASAMALANHLLAFFLGLELLSVSLYALIAYLPGRPKGLEAGVKYLVLAAGSSAFLVFGLGLIYFRLGSLSLPRLAALLGSAGYDPILQAGLGLSVVGFGFKLAVVPFHFWSPDVYEGAPAPVSAFVATASKGAAAAVLVRFFVQLGLVAEPWWALVFAVIAAASMLAGNLLALLQTNLKRLLAYSSIAHLGYVLVAALAGGPRSAQAVAFYLAAYFATILGAFGIIAAWSRAGREPDQLRDLRGLGRERPWSSAALTLMLLSLAGIPLTGGFMAKYLVVSAGVGSTLWGLLFVLLASSAIGLYAYLRVVVTLYMRQRTMDPAEPVAAGRFGLAAGLALLALVGALLWLGVYPRAALAWIQSATESLF